MRSHCISVSHPSVLTVIGFVDQDSDLESGSVLGSRKAKVTHKKDKSEEISCFEVLDGLFSELEPSVS
jgi:hypothetical protein